MKKILLDTDAGVDDILALFLLLRCPDMARLLGITLVAGNTEMAHCVANIRRALGVAAAYADGRAADVAGIPLAVGAEAPLMRPLLQAAEVHGPDGLGGTSFLTTDGGQPLYVEYPAALDPRTAPALILDTAAEHPGEVTLLAIGPLTNLALALRQDPARFRLLQELVIMGGTFRNDGNTGPRTEFNIHVDPEAAQEVFNSGVPITLVPLDCSEQTRLMAHERDGDGPVHRFVRDATDMIVAFHKRFEGFEGCFHHDPLAAGVALDPSFVSGVTVRVDVETKGQYTSGETVAGLRPDRPLFPGPANALVCLTPDAARFEQFFLNRVLPPGA